MSKVPTKDGEAIRCLNLFDAFRCGLLGEPREQNRAHSFASLDRENTFLSLISASGLVRGRRRGWVRWRRNRLSGLITADQRSGSQSWEVISLFLTPFEESGLPELLEEVSQHAASCAGERVFLRMLRDDPLSQTARLSGYFPRIPETLYMASPHGVQASADERFLGNGASLRRRNLSDQHDLFRLYNTVTPREVRSAFGMTFSQWDASRERCWGRFNELALDVEGKLGGWLNVGLKSGVGRLNAVVHPHYEDLLGAMIDWGLGQLVGAKVVYCLVPEYQPSLQTALADRGFSPVSSYVTLVKTMAIRAEEHAQLRAPVAST